MKRLFVCEDCPRPPDAPMLEDAVWLPIAEKTTLLCTGCTETRLGRRLTLKDLRACIANDPIALFAARLSPDVDPTDYAGHHRIAHLLT